MTFNHEKILNILKTSLSKFLSREYLSNTKKDLSDFLGKVTPSKESGRIVQNLIGTVSNTSFRENIKALTPLKVDNLGSETDTVVTSTWKSDVLKTQLVSQLRHILKSIEDAETFPSFQGRTEALIAYIDRHPEARLISVKEGAVRILLNTRKKFKNKDQATLSQALALLGHTDPLPGKGIRILSIDGGGIRGLLVLEMLKKLEELSGKRIYELFDLVCGTSTGAIIAFAMGIHHVPLDEIGKHYTEISREVFKQSALWGTGNLVWTQSYYSTPLWEKNLKKFLGELKLIETARDPLCPKLCAVSAVVNQSHLSAYLFRNYCLPWKVRSQYFGSSTHKVWEAARASAAAPTYFEEFKLGDLIHQDGGILTNNPTAIAIHEAKLLWPHETIHCVVSFGTGRTVPINRRDGEKLVDSSVNTSWTNKFMKILDSATDTEGVHTMLNDLLPDEVYYRFNPYLLEMVSMVEIDDKKLEQLKRDALMYLRRNEDKFSAAAKALTEPKTYMQKSSDWLSQKRDFYGI